MPSEHQHGASRDCRSEPHRHVCEWPEERLLKLHPMVESTARQYLAACNQLNASVDVKEHFARCVREAPY